MDRISELPEFILHHILSFIDSDPQLVRMSVLSKTWFHLTASFPILYFSLNDDLISRESFFKYVEYTTSRFCHQKVTTAQKLTLRATLSEPAEIDIVNQCLELLLQKGVRLLDIRIITYKKKFRLPNTLLSISMLESLCLSGCKLPSSLMVDAVKFKSLIQLILYGVPVDDEAITRLTTSCPLLRVFQIALCPGYKSFCVYGHQNLRELIIMHDTSLKIIDVEAPNLSTFSLIDVGNIKCNNLKLSSHALRTLILHLHLDLEEIELNTPNLVVFNYCHTDTRWLTLRHLTHLKGVMKYYTDADTIDALWFHKLRLFLDKKSGFKVMNLFIDVAADNLIFVELEELKAIELPPYELENVELLLRKESTTHIAFVDAVLCCCRPRSLIISYPNSSFKLQSDFVKFTSEKLLLQEDESRTNIQIVESSSSLLMESAPNRKSIIFTKEKGAG